MGNQPEKKFRAGAISATIWANQAQGPNGPVVYKTISLERGYKDKEDKWQSTNSLRINDIPKARLVLAKAYEYLALTPEGGGNSTIVQNQEEIIM